MFDTTSNVLVAVRDDQLGSRTIWKNLQIEQSFAHMCNFEAHVCAFTN
jgi:hypothetical protein